MPMKEREYHSSYLLRCRHPRHLKRGEGPALFFFAHYTFYGQWDSDQKVFKNLSFEGADKEGDRGLVDGCLELFGQRDRESVKAIGLREVENFLRGQNQHPAFDPQSPPLKAVFDGLKSRFLRLFPSTPFGELSLLQKAIRVQQALAHKEGESVQVVDIQGLDIFVRGTQQKGEFFSRVLAKKFQQPHINVIVVP